MSNVIACHRCTLIGESVHLHPNFNGMYLCSYCREEFSIFWNNPGPRPFKMGALPKCVNRGHSTAKKGGN